MNPAAALLVACPTCHAGVGEQCQIRGKRLRGVHATRVQVVQDRNRDRGVIR